MGELKKSEAKIQSECFMWFNNSFPHLRGLLYHVPNGEKRDPITANKLKAMGVVAGVPDLEFHFRAKTYFFEFKDSEKSKPSPAQVKVHRALDQQRFHVWVVWEAESFKNIIASILLDESDRNTWGLTRTEYEYKDKVFRYLYNMKAGEIFSIDDLCTPETKDKFVMYVTEFIMEGYDNLDNFEILFTANFKHLYKIDDSVDKESLINKYSVAKWRQEHREMVKKKEEDQKQ